MFRSVQNPPHGKQPDYSREPSGYPPSDSFLGLLVRWWNKKAH